MKRYGLRIGDVGVEFVSRDERQKAMINFTTGTCIKIKSSGIRYEDHEGAFSTYERNDEEILTNCYVCNGVFGVDTCPKRDYPNKYYGDEEYKDREDYICDGCLEAARKAKELFEAKKVVEKAQCD